MIALAYYQRFFLVNNMFEFHPGHFMHPCLFLAIKISELNLPFMLFCEKFELDPKMNPPLDYNEQILLNGLNY